MPRFRLEAFHTPPLYASETRRPLRFFNQPSKREQIGIAQLVLALTKVLNFDQAFFHQGLEAEIDAAQTNAQFFGQDALTDLWRLMQTAQDFELDFLLETSQLLR